jgi:hypothetical protein
VGRFLAELDSGRDFRGQGGIIGSILNYVATAGFREFAERHEFPFRSALEHRERYIIEALRG